MSEFEFDPNNYSHRLMLALAIRDYSKPIGQHPGMGEEAKKSRSADKPTLRRALEKADIPISKGQIDRITAAPPPGKKQKPYSSGAPLVAEFLRREGYFPPAQNVQNTLKILPLFFDGFASRAAPFLSEIAGTYTSYQFSSRHPDTVLTGTLIIGECTPWNFAPAEETIVLPASGGHTLVYEGVAFSDDERVLYILAREREDGHPRFYLFEDCISPSGPKNIETINGTILGGARQRRRHLSPISLFKGKPPKLTKTVRANDLSALPQAVRDYLSRAMMPGPENEAL